ncbi:uncharacterized protein CIMG_12306 [Coccidioides immitis RS]|uniref:Uncharacterized protein n=7 Tax=Coccidioides TaxID=5500 RepID=J3K1U3_COCIM|nr:uncharacterized protein CIMG_12306 [Coccidioides immitis RS]XP_003067158.1 hypothetical protein CPC735_016130 [Coccidioides posadasii C735 delta SOWgp]EFW19363.1 conserved hypothetical protein [Coccidioides posadasii str. Silveira]KMM71824.1 hypothetical protein CPAG_08125 [Coccidioides posadasii RMSCC 3488]KMP08802.1 hypothetical protein CIRG_08483 [Coccidioides immitis RMSCC 2394]KMU78800.1 hypothetical protein CISG_01840 [Coccidioides immitis RMSCC 3703]KMU87934.1 hypothetical protein C|eukprot:XP_003067158.1 hypothetical protein CPC735_016130 [Coccidioides posadasii C735 delta SOWgp]
MSGNTRHAASPDGRERAGAEHMHDQRGSNMQTHESPQLRDPFTGRSPSTDSGVIEAESPTQGDARRSDPLSTSESKSPLRDRRMSKEWDAAKVPPSRFQKPEGSIFSTSSSRDSHITRRDRDASYHAKLKEKGWV